MNFLRRLYLALLTIVLIIAITLFLLFPRTVNNWSAALSEQSPLIPVLVTAVLDILLLVLLYIQVRPDPRERATGLMMQASGAITEVSVESARDRILKAVSEVPDVISAEAEVKPVRGKADIELQVTVTGRDVQLPAKQKEINRALNQVIHKQLGLRMAGQARVHIRFHGESAPPSALSLVPAPVKPVEVAPLPKPVSSEPEPQKSLGLFSLPKRDKPAEEEKIIKRSSFSSLQEPLKVESSNVDDDESEKTDISSLNLEKEIASSSKDDIRIDDVVDDEVDEDEKDDEKPTGVSDSQTGINHNNNRI